MTNSTSANDERTVTAKANAGKVLYHYSPLIFLSDILHEGLSKGDVAHPDFAVQQQGVSLTTQTDPDRLYCWGPHLLPTRCAVRYRCRLPEPKLLQSARDVWKKLGVSRAFVKACDPYGMSKWWSVYFGIIRRDYFDVEVRDRDGYSPLTGEALAVAERKVASVREQMEIVSPPDAPHLLLSRARSGANEDLLDAFRSAEYPADLLS